MRMLSTRTGPAPRPACVSGGSASQAAMRRCGRAAGYSVNAIAGGADRAFLLRKGFEHIYRPAVVRSYGITLPIEGRVFPEARPSNVWGIRISRYVPPSRRCYFCRAISMILRTNVVNAIAAPTIATTRIAVVVSMEITSI